MKIIKKSVILEVPETLESGSAKVLCDKPYWIERFENDKEIIWFGWNTNWKLDKKTYQWYTLIKSEFVVCDTPEYEKLYNKLLNNQ